DLCEKLWDICDVRKTDSEKERQSIIDDNWLQDHVGLISNHYISLMQAELTKFQDAVLLLKDYYLSMTSDVPSPLPDCNSRIPIIELTVPEEESQSTTATDGGGVAEKNKENKKESPKPMEEDKCVPLLIRQLITVPEAPPVEEKGRKKVEREPTPPPAGTEDISELSLDTQLIVHSYNTALVLASKLVNGKFVGQFGNKRFGPGQLNGPMGITTDTAATGLVYVSEWGNHRISVFTSDGNFVNKFGSMGRNVNQFDTPYGLAFNEDGTLYVCDFNNKRLVVY
ncbi:PREDICTED: RING finger protein nhl-1-like, partial [Amphimedon queenslandica]|uniref:Uncharacterized protein n=2 Tax=Amphimedon queenslandica TaxID=400682 RepID=A0AAN0JWH8_AMPQE